MTEGEVSGMGDVPHRLVDEWAEEVVKADRRYQEIEAGSSLRAAIDAARKESSPPSPESAVGPTEVPDVPR